MGRDEKSSAKYQSILERDAALEASYRLSPATQALIGDRRSDSMVTTLYAHLAEIAELYQRECENYRGRRLRESVKIWLMKHCGMVEPVIENMLVFEVKRRIDGKVRNELFVDYREQRRWERPARRMMADPEWQQMESLEQKLGFIAAAAGWKPADLRVKQLAKSMPRPVRYLDEATYNRRMEELRKQAAEIQREQSHE
jgi:hypothetical protein